MLIAITNCCAGRMSGNLSSIPYSDTLIPTQDTTLRKLLIAGEERNNLKRQVKNLEEQVRLLNEVIKEQESRDSVMSEYHVNQMNNLKEQIALCKEQIKVFEKMIRVEKRKRFWTGVFGMLSTIIMIFLSLKK